MINTVYDVIRVNMLPVDFEKLSVNDQAALDWAVTTSLDQASLRIEIKNWLPGKDRNLKMFLLSIEKMVDSLVREVIQRQELLTDFQSKQDPLKSYHKDLVQNGIPVLAWGKPVPLVGAQLSKISIAKNTKNALRDLSCKKKYR